MLVVLMVWVAAQLIIETINKEKINSSTSTTMEAIPSNYTFELSTFKFGIEIEGMDLYDWDADISYFDVVVGEITYDNGNQTVEYF